MRLMLICSSRHLPGTHHFAWRAAAWACSAQSNPLLDKMLCSVEVSLSSAMSQQGHNQTCMFPAHVPARAQLDVHHFQRMFQQGHNQTVRIAVCVCAFCMLCAVQLCCWHCRYAILGAMTCIEPCSHLAACVQPGHCSSHGAGAQLRVGAGCPPRGAGGR